MTTTSRFKDESIENASQDKLRHSYPAAVRERRWPEPGDVARCGYVKRDMTTPPGRWGEAGVCIVCEALFLSI
jgi:hypothetical protein